MLYELIVRGAPLPPPATEKPKRGPEGCCQVIIGKDFAGADICCPKRVASKKLKILVNLLVLGAGMWGVPENKHHCRHCLARVCSFHFMPNVPNSLGGISQITEPLCSACVSVGVLTAPARP